MHHSVVPPVLGYIGSLFFVHHILGSPVPGYIGCLFRVHHSVGPPVPGYIFGRSNEKAGTPLPRRVRRTGVYRQGFCAHAGVVCALVCAGRDGVRTNVCSQGWCAH